MAREPRTARYTELGVAGEYDPRNGLRQDEFLLDLRGTRAMRKYREMRDNDPIVGSILTAMDMMMRGVDWKVEATEGTGGGSSEAVEFIEQCIDDMDDSWADFVSNVLTFLPYGFSVFEKVYKRRMGRNRRMPSRNSKFDDGKIGIRKLSPRAQWTIDRFDVASTGEILGVVQRATWAQFQEVYIPVHKMLHFRTSAVNNDPAGRSVLRNAYIPYYYASHIQSLESIAIERELNGLPLGRVPAKWLSSDATDAEAAFVTAYKDILSKVRKNEVGYMLIPSDVYEDENERPSPQRRVEFELVASKGTRDIDTHKVITRHHHDMARTVLADFIMLGATERGSFALSQDKTNLFLKSITGYLKSIKETVNRQLLPELLEINGYDPNSVQVSHGKVAQHDLDVFSKVVERMVGARPGLAQSDDFWTHIFEQTGFPQLEEIPEDPEAVLPGPMVAPAEDEEEPPQPEEDPDGSTPTD